MLGAGITMIALAIVTVLVMDWLVCAVAHFAAGEMRPARKENGGEASEQSDWPLRTKGMDRTHVGKQT